MPGDLVPGTEKGSPALAQRVFPESLTPLRRPLSGRAGSLRLWRGRTPHPSSPSYSPPGQAGGLPAASGDSRRAREPVRGGWGWLTAPRQPRRLERWEQAGGCAGGRSYIKGQSFGCIFLIRPLDLTDPLHFEIHTENFSYTRRQSLIMFID